LSSVNGQRASYCTSCYTGRYPIPFPRDKAAHLQLPLRLVRDPAEI
jgi:hypothetical protein